MKKWNKNYSFESFQFRDDFLKNAISLYKTKFHPILFLNLIEIPSHLYYNYKNIKVQALLKS